jgi:subtilase family serine protease
MKLQSLFLRTSLFVSALILSCFLASRVSAQSNAQSANPSSFVHTPAVPARITQAIDETQLVRLKGNVHPLARPEFDQGAVPDSTPVARALLLLQRGQEQETALQQLLAEQQVKDSPNFHNWLTPQQFGAQFGPADADIQTVTQWLTGHGFHDVKVGAGRTTIEFSGNIAQVRSAFHTEIHQFNVNGRMHLANVSDPQIPAALSPVIANVLGLHDFRPRSLLHRVQNFNKRIVGKEVTFTCGPTGASFPCFGVAPADFAKIYNVPATVGTNPAGQGVSIAIVQDSNVNVSDIQQFRTAFGLTGGAFNVILNGPDPGIQDPTTISGDETEADLDVELAGGVAPGATIDLVVSESPFTLGAAGIDLSAIYIINSNLAPIMSESFGSCETATNGVEPFYAALWEQAASQGITVVVAAGDAGSDTCGQFTGLDFATTGLSLSGIASTPFNVALGGTDFQNGSTPSTYWASPGTPTESAKSYIPESTWNSGCAAGATSSTLSTVCTATIINNNTANGNLVDILGGGGGQSSVTANTKPSWQTGITPAADTRRDIPDISLYSAVNSSNNTFYLICEADSGAQTGACDPATANVTLIGGTSAAAPAFAGIMAMVVQQQGGEPAGRQGNANFVLYNLYRKNIGNATTICASNAANVSATGCIFYDVITGNNSVACAGGTPNCSNTNGAANQYGVLVDPASATTPAFTAVAGYDKATGLGSVNVSNLLKNWASGSLASDTTSITSSPSGTIGHGTNASFTVKVTQGSGTTVPTGDVSLIATPSGGTAVAIGQSQTGPPSTLTNGSITFSTNLLPGGTDSVVAQYSGDATFAPGQSSPVTVTVSKEASKTAITMWTFDSAGNVLSNNATTAVYGSAYVLRVDVTNSSGTQCSTSTTTIPCPTGQVSVTDNGTALNDFSSPSSSLPAGTTTLNSLGFFEDQPVQLPGGTNALQAVYAGDTSYTGSPSTTDTVMITAAATAASVLATPASGVTTTTSVTLTATIATASSGNGPTGSVTFSAGGSTLGTVTVVPTAASGLNTNAPVAAFGTATMTHTFSTAGTYTVSASYTTGDTNYTGSASSGAGNATVVVTSATTGSFTVSGAAVTVMAGSSGMSAITVTPSGGFTGTVNVTCPAASLPPGVTCSPNPLAINITSASPVANNLTIAVAAPSSTTSASVIPAERKMYFAGLAPTTPGGKGLWGLSAITGLAAMLLLLLPGRKRYRAALALGLICVLSFTLGCGGGYGGGGGTSATTTKISVTSTKVASGTSIPFSVTVTSTGTRMPTGSVQLYDGAAILGTAGTLASGSATINISTLSVGTHAISAHYLADAYSTASQSGTLDMAITGSTTVAITGTSGTTTANGTVNLTIN